MNILVIDLDGGQYAVIEVQDDIDVLEAASMAAFAMLEQRGEKSRIVVFASDGRIQNMTDEVADLWKSMAEGTNVDQRGKA